MCNFTRNQNAFGTEIHPIERKIGEIDSPVLRFLLNMSLETEVVHPTRLACKKAFMIGALMFIDNATVNGEERREKRRSIFRCRILRSGHRKWQGRDH
jgi:hypothetical protein